MCQNFSGNARALEETPEEGLHLPKRNYQVIIPTLNEEKRIGAVLSGLNAGRDAFVIDGGSADKTLRIARAHKATVISEPKAGNGAAFKKGALAARARYIATIDGDGTYPAGQIGKCLEIMEARGADALFGDRLANGRGTMRPAHYAGNLLVTFFINAIFGTRMTDSQSGFCIFRKSAVLENMPVSDGMPHCQEIKIRLLKSGRKCITVPIEYHDRRNGSKFRFFQDGISLAWEAIMLKAGGL